MQNKFKHHLTQNIESVSYKIEIFLDYASKYSQILLIGVKDKFHTHAYIHQQWKYFFDKLRIKCLLLENTLEAEKYITKNSLIVYPDIFVPKSLAVPFRDDCSYILHRGESPTLVLPNGIRVLNLYEYRNVFVNSKDYPESAIEIKHFVWIAPSAKRLIQPWGCPLMEHEFYQPISWRKHRKIFFVGTIWKQNKQLLEIVKKDLAAKGYEFIIKNKLSQKDEIAYIRHSFASCAPASASHLLQDYLQCRIFKNIAYGRLTFTDQNAFKHILGKSFIPIINFADVISIIEILPPTIEEEFCLLQQNAIKNYTYLDMWINIFHYLDIFNP